MAIKKKKISELPLAQSLVGLFTIGVDSLNKSVKVGLEFVKTAADKAAAAATSANTAASEATTAKNAANTATTAANAARDAANTAAINANSKAILADTAATNADTKAALANTATTAANTAATNANAKATLADQKATDANTAAINANAKATLADNAADNANTKATLADQKAIVANTAATDANKAKDAANTAATNANTKAILADTAAINANAKAMLADQKATVANTAATDANKAKDAANTARDAANAAATSATGAATAATNAASSANTAAGRTETAITNAQNATSAANTAKTNADTATTAANTAATNANTKATLASTAATNADAKAILADQKATAATTAANSANTATAEANKAKDSANTAAANANTKATLADMAANNANAKATLADTAANNANTKATLADTAATKANTATTAANTAKDDANTATANANAKAALADAAAANANSNATLANTATANANAATSAANTATTLATEVANNPTKVGPDNYVYTYDKTTKTYIKTDIYVKGDKGEDGSGGFQVDEVRMSYSLRGNIFGDKYLPCDGRVVQALSYPDSHLPGEKYKTTLTHASPIIKLKYLIDGTFAALCSNVVFLSDTASGPWVGHPVPSEYSLYDITLGETVYGLVYFIAAGGGRIYISTDLQSYTTINTGETANMNPIKYFEGRMFALASNGFLYYSPFDDPSSWKRANRSTHPLIDIVGGRAGCMAGIGNLGTILYSSDYGKNWHSEVTEETYGQELVSIIYDGSSFFAVSASGKIFKSPSGELSTWELFANLPNIKPTKMYYQNRLYILVEGASMYTSRSASSSSWIKETPGSSVVNIGSVAMVASDTLISKGNIVLRNYSTLKLPTIDNGYIKLLK